MEFKGVKLVVNLHEGRMEKNHEDEMMNFLTSITGRKPFIIKARKSVSNFNIRKGMISGALVTLRDKSAFNFLKKITLFVLSGDSTFKGFKKNLLKRDNLLDFSVKNPYLFPEIEELKFIKGFNVSIFTKDREKLLDLLKKANFPIN